MSAQKFLADVENGVTLVDSHEKALWIAFIYLDEALWVGTGVFDVIEKLYAYGWSFGKGELRLNRLVLPSISPISHHTNQSQTKHPGSILPSPACSSHLPLLQLN
jgi:hypothetical protein